MSSDIEAFKTRLLPILRCPSCRAALVLRPGPPAGQHLLRLHGEHLSCQGCGASFPLTDDLIPILFGDGLLDESGAPGTDTNLAANIAVYDRISDDYGAHTRQESALATRMRNAVARGGGPRGGAHAASPMFHLDYGCGPGHVLSWLKRPGLDQIGMDVSLRNLRNARATTGCFVVRADACRMPFADGSVDLVTESSVLHHIERWRDAVKESVRVCRAGGRVVIDSEPSQAQLAWSRLARWVFDLRFVAYRALSYVAKDKYVFRDSALARLNQLAEIHHQPGTGFPVEEVRALFDASGADVEIVMSPAPDLRSRARPSWKGIVLSLLSFRNPWNPRYGTFTAIGTRRT